MDQFLKGLYGTADDDDDQARVSKATDFVSRVETGNKAEGYSTQEAVQNYKNVTQGLSDDEFESVAADALNQLTPEQRREFTQVIKQNAGVDLDDNVDDPQQLAALTKQFRSQSGGGDLGGLLGGLLGGGGGSSDDIMGMIGGLFGGGGTGGIGTTGAGSQGTSQAGIAGLLGNPIVKMVLGLIAAAAMKRMMGGGGQSQHVATARPSSGSQDDSGGGGILDSLFGGGDDNSASERARQDQGNQGNQGGGGFLDSLFGGDNDTAPTRNAGSKKVDVSRIDADRKKKGI